MSTLATKSPRNCKTIARKGAAAVAAAKALVRTCIAIANYIKRKYLVAIRSYISYVLSAIL